VGNLKRRSKLEVEGLPDSAMSPLISRWLVTAGTAAEVHSGAQLPLELCCAPRNPATQPTACSHIRRNVFTRKLIWFWPHSLHIMHGSVTDTMMITNKLVRYILLH
jgi:hypothetical protein